MPRRRKRAAVKFDDDLLLQATFRDTEVLQHFISGQNKILPRRKTGLSAKTQRHIAAEIKRAREMSLLQYRGQAR